MNKQLYNSSTQSGAALMLFVIFFMIASTIFTSLYFLIVYSDLRTAKQIVTSKQAHFVAESGIEDLAVRFGTGKFFNSVEHLQIGSSAATTTTVFDPSNDEFVITAKASLADNVRISEMVLAEGIGTSFNFGVQTGNGGFAMTNSSFVRGDVYSNGPVRKTGGGTATIYGDVISAGPTGLIEDITATGSAYANVIRDANVGDNSNQVESAYADLLDGGDIYANAYYETKIGGTAIWPPGVDLGPVTVDDMPNTVLPISDAVIDRIKDDVVTNGKVIAATDPGCSTGTFTMDVSTTTGFLKVECDVEIRKTAGSVVVTLTGPLWIEGDLDITQGPDIRIDPTAGARSVAIVVDNESDRETSSRIGVRNPTNFDGSGNPKSYVFLISQNESFENGGSEIAIDFDNSATGDVIGYASHGMIDVANSIALKEITGYQIRLGNGANVTYESGLTNILFISGPSSGFTISSWNEI